MRYSTDLEQIIAYTYKMSAQQRMFREKEKFNRSRADYFLHEQDAASADDVSGEGGDIQQIESRLFSVRTKCRISR
jgi:hypothetical protein